MSAANMVPRRRIRSRFAALLLVLGATASSAFASDAQQQALGALPLLGLDRQPHRLDEWAGKFRLVSLWATWCTPCLREIPELNAVANTWAAKGVAVIGVAVDGEAEVRASKATGQIEYPVLIATERLADLLKLADNPSGAVPFTLLLDKQGKVLQRHAGPVDQATITRWLSRATAAR